MRLPASVGRALPTRWGRGAIPLSFPSLTTYKRDRLDTN